MEFFSKNIFLNILFFSFLICFLYNLNLYSANTQNSKGSSTVYTLGVTEDYNGAGPYDVYGFVQYQDGLSFSTSCTLNMGLACPIVGAIILNTDHSTINMISDLTISVSGTFSTIIGNNNSPVSSWQHASFTNSDASKSRNIYINGSNKILFIDGDFIIPQKTKIHIGEDVTVYVAGDLKLSRDSVRYWPYRKHTGDVALYLGKNSNLIVSGSSYFSAQTDLFVTVPCYMWSNGLSFSQTVNIRISCDDTLITGTDSFCIDLQNNGLYFEGPNSIYLNKNTKY